MILLFLCFSCNYRTPGDKRFENNIGFALPDDKSVLKDEYQDMLQDYVVIYEAKLTEESNNQFKEKLKSMVSAPASDNNCRWLYADHGFAYLCDKSRTVYSVKFDTITGIVTYKEESD